MFRNMMGEPKPANHEEVVEAAEELGIDLSNAMARISEPDPEDEEPFKGWTAEITGDNDDGEAVILNTAGFATKEDLIGALEPYGVEIEK